MPTATVTRKINQATAKIKFANVGLFIPLHEAAGAPALDKGKRMARCILITEGLGNLRDKNFYTAEAIESCPAVFENKQFYLDHPSQSEEQDRPERSVRDLAGYFRNCSVGDIKDPSTGETLKACFANVFFSESEAGEEAMGQVATAIKFQQDNPRTKEVYAGISINAGGISEPGEIDGMEVNLVREIRDAFSADIVTKPARGGKFLSLQEAAAAAAKRALAGLPSKETEMKLKRLSEATRTRFRALVKKEREKHLTESEKLELSKIRRKLLEKGAVPRVPGTSTAAEDEGGEDEGEEEGEKADEGERAGEDERTDEGERQDEGEGEDEGEDEGEEEGEDGGDPTMPAMQMAERLVAKMQSLRTALGYADEGERQDEGERTDEGEDGAGKIGPVDAGDPSAIVDDMKQDLAALADHLGALGGDQQDEDEHMVPGGGHGEPDGDEPGAPGAGAGGGGGERPMTYSCTACGEKNEVLPPKGYSLQRMGESARRGFGKIYREALAAARRQLRGKEARFAVRNVETKRLVERLVNVEAENKVFRKERDARKLLREAGLPADILSLKDLMGMDRSVWNFAIKTAKGRSKTESRLTEALPTGIGGRFGGPTRGSGKAAVAAFDARYRQS